MCDKLTSTRKRDVSNSPTLSSEDHLDDDSDYVRNDQRHCSDEDWEELVSDGEG